MRAWSDAKLPVQQGTNCAYIAENIRILEFILFQKDVLAVTLIFLARDEAARPDNAVPPFHP